MNSKATIVKTVRQENRPVYGQKLKPHPGGGYSSGYDEGGFTQDKALINDKSEWLIRKKIKSNSSQKTLKLIPKGVF